MGTSILWKASCFLLVVVMSASSTAESGPSFVSLSEKEATAVKKLRTIIVPKLLPDSKVRNYIKDDLYLVKWLKANSFDVTKAEQDLIQHLNWRWKEKIDKIEDEEWSYFLSEYVIHTGHLDKRGNPVSEMWLSEWNVRKAVMGGMGNRLVRWITRMMEVQQRELYEQRAKGKNATHAVILVDMERYNVITTGCVVCMAIYNKFGWTWETHYPELYENIYMVNSPPPFSMILVGMRQLMRPTTKTAVKSYWEKRVWKPVLNSKIDMNQRSVRFGGTLNKEE